LKSSLLDCHCSVRVRPSWPIITRCYHGRFDTYILCPTHMIVSCQAHPCQPMATGLKLACQIKLRLRAARPIITLPCRIVLSLCGPFVPCGSFETLHRYQI
jgi:hypothetical protein